MRCILPQIRPSAQPSPGRARTLDTLAPSLVVSLHDHEGTPLLRFPFPLFSQNHAFDARISFPSPTIRTMKRLPFLLVLAALLAPAARAVQLDATAFDRRVPITVSGYTGASPLTNFPVLVKLAADAPTGFVYGDCAENGADLRFADGTGSLVPHEIESWNPSGDSFIWVQVPILSGTATSLSLYYGADPTGLPAVDPTNVWTRYAAVFHGGATIADAKGVATVTAGSVTGADSGGMAGGLMTKGSVTGLQYSNPVTSGALSDIGAFSISGWFKRSNSGTSGNAKTAVVASNKGKDEWSANNGFTALVEGGSYFSVGVGAHQGTAGKGALQSGVVTSMITPPLSICASSLLS